MRRALVLLAACHKDAPPAPAPPPATTPITVETAAPEAFGSGDHASMRRGTLPLTPPMQFALLGTDGVYDEEFQMVAFDLNRDGNLDTSSLDSDELTHNFEKHVTLDGRSYEFAIDHRGASLTLTPLAKPLPPRTPLHAGAPAPDFTASTLEGGTIRLAQLEGKTVLLDFWSKSCTPCLRSMPIIEELPAKGYEVVSIADAEGGDVTALVKGHPGHHVVDSGQLQAQYRIDRFPTYFLVGKDGNIACARCPLPKILDTPP
jgi:thiol-disulfide isomerase/thioredoxin